MNFLMENIGNIVIGIGGFIALGGLTSDKEAADKFAEEAWFHSKENPCGPNYEGI